MIRMNAVSMMAMLGACGGAPSSGIVTTEPPDAADAGADDERGPDAGTGDAVANNDAMLSCHGQATVGGQGAGAYAWTYRVDETTGRACASSSPDDGGAGASACVSGCTKVWGCNVTLSNGWLMYLIPSGNDADPIPWYVSITWPDFGALENSTAPCTAD